MTDARSGRGRNVAYSRRVHFTPELETGPTPRGGAGGGGGERVAPTKDKGSKARARRGGLKQTTAPKLQIANHASFVDDFGQPELETPRSRRGSAEWWGDSVISFLQAAVSPLMDGSSNTSEDQWWAPSDAPAPPNASSLPKPLPKKKGPPPPISRRPLVVGMGSRRGSATNMSWMIPCSASPTCASSSQLCVSPSPKCASGGGSGAGRERMSKFLRG